MRQGDQVIVRAFGERPIKAHFWEDSGEGALVVSARAYKAFEQQGEAPSAVGLDKRDIFIFEESVYHDLKVAFERGETKHLQMFWDRAQRVKATVSR